MMLPYTNTAKTSRWTLMCHDFHRFLHNNSRIALVIEFWERFNRILSAKFILILSSHRYILIDLGISAEPFCLLRLHAKIQIKIATATRKTITPTPIPALAPLDKGLLFVPVGPVCGVVDVVGRELAEFVVRGVRPDVDWDFVDDIIE